MENLNASSDQLLCTDFVDFGKHNDRFGRISWSKIEKNGDKHLEVQLKTFGRNETGDFKRRQILSMGEYDFKQFIRQRNQLAKAAADFLKEDNLTALTLPHFARDLEIQLKQVQKAYDVVDRSHRKVIVTMMRYKIDEPDTSYVQVRLFGRRKVEEDFKQIVFVNYKLDEFVYLLDVIQSACDQILDNQPMCNIV